MERKAQLLIHRHLNQPGIEIKRVKRLGVKDDYDGIVKIELGSEAEVQTVLQSKSILGQHRDESLHGIFIRQSQPENERRNVRNMNTLIREVDPEGNSGLYVNYKGVVLRRRGYGYRRGNSSGPRGRPARGRGRGGSRERPMRVGADFVNAWSPSIDPSGGQNVGGRGGRGRSNSVDSVASLNSGGRTDTGEQQGHQTAGGEWYTSAGPRIQTSPLEIN